MKRPRIVLDTSVLVSAALKPLSQPALVLNLIAVSAVELCISSDILAEYREVFSRRKFCHLNQNEVARLLSVIERGATMVTPTERLAISSHDADNRFYECADTAAADYIVTGNVKHFRQEYKTIKIVNPRQFLNMFTPK